VRIHLGHHFYGAGNLGDDFMLAGFFAAMRSLAPRATFTCSVPFPLDPLKRRFPEVEWLPYEPAVRQQAIVACDVWLGLGGSPFQHAQSRWFVDHLVGDAEYCAAAGKRMYFLGIGVQTPAELADPDVRQLGTGAAGIWTRDPASAERLRSLASRSTVGVGADFAHVYFRDTPPPPAKSGRLTLVPNFDYAAWPGQPAFLAAARKLPATDRVWLAQESRDLPGAERALHATLPETEKRIWRLAAPDDPGTSLAGALARWPSGEWLVTARYHAALAGCWAGSKIVIIATNEKLQAAARELGCPTISSDASAEAVAQALTAGLPVNRATAAADLACAACAEFVRAASRSALAGSS
jgi:hypothetical protein